jgi:hypothetical protein
MLSFGRVKTCRPRFLPFEVHGSENNNQVPGRIFMKIVFTQILLLLAALCFATATLAADHNPERIVNLYQCKLNEGKSIDDVHAANGKWSGYVNANVAGGDIQSFVLQTVVGNTGTFLYADSYPSLAAWEAVSKIESDEMKEIEKGLDEAAECSSNTLHRARESK